MIPHKSLIFSSYLESLTDSMLLIAHGLSLSSYKELSCLFPFMEPFLYLLLPYSYSRRNLTLVPVGTILLFPKESYFCPCRNLYLLSQKEPLSIHLYLCYVTRHITLVPWTIYSLYLINRSSINHLILNSFST